MLDMVSHNPMLLTKNAALSSNRFSEPESAIRLSTGYASSKNYVTFGPETGGFAVMSWVKFITLDRPRVFQIFHDSATDDQINVSVGNNNELGFVLKVNGVATISTLAGAFVVTNQWYHLALSVTPTRVSLYLDGTEVYYADYPGNSSIFNVN